MNERRFPARVNVKALVILVALVLAIGGGGAIAYKIRKRVMADRALAAGKAALENEDWGKACTKLRFYLSKYPDDEEILADYAEANLAVRPLDAGHIGAAIGAYRRMLRHRPGDAETSRQLAKLYFQVGDYGEAAYICRQRLEAEAEDPEVLLLLGRALAGRRQYDQARDPLSRLVGLANKHANQVKAYGLLVDLELREDSAAAAENAVKWLDDAVEAHPESAEAWLLRGRLRRRLSMLKTSEPEEALQIEADTKADLSRAEALQPADPGVQLGLAAEWLARQELDRARAQLVSAEQASPETLERFDIEANAFALARYTVAGRLALRKDDGQACVTLAREALLELPGTRRAVFLPLAAELFLAGRDAAAARATVDEYRKTLDEQDGADVSVEASLDLLDALVADAEGRPYVAINLLTDVVVREPHPDGAWKLLWRAYRATRQPRRALAALEEYLTRSGGDAEMLVAAANAYRTRNWPKAQHYASRAEQLDPANLEAKLLRIEAAIRGGGGELSESQAQELAAELASLRQSHPSAVGIRLVEALMASRVGSPTDGVSHLERAIEECDDPLAAVLELATIHAREDRFEDAVEVVKRAIAARPDVAQPRLVLASLQLAADRPDEAEQVLQDATAELAGAEQAVAAYSLAAHLVAHGRRQEAIDRLQELASERSDDVWPRLMLLELKEVSTDVARSQELVDELKGIEGDQGVHWRVEQAKLWLRKSDWKTRQQTIKELLVDCIGADPSGLAPVLLLGQMYERVGRSSRAESTYRRAINAYPGQLEVVARLLKLLERQGRFAEARLLLEQAPGDRSALSAHRVEVALGLGDYDAAIEELRRRVATDTSDATSRIVLARLIYQQTRDLDAAFELLDQAGEEGLDRTAVLATRTRLLAEEGRGDEAAALLDAEVARRNDPAAYRLRAGYYASTGRLELAEQDLVHLTGLPDAGAADYAALGRFYQQSGRIAEAITALGTGLTADPDNDPLRRLLLNVLLGSQDGSAHARGEGLLAQLLAEWPDDPDLLILQARLLLADKSAEATQEGDRILERVIRIDPHSVVAHKLLIQLAQQQGDGVQIDARITRALGANPANAELILARAKLEIDRGNLEVAWALARSVLERGSIPPSALNPLAEIALRTGATDLAQSLNEKALAFDPTAEEGQILHASILSGKGELGTAIRELETYRQTAEGSRSLMTLLALAESYREQGDLVKAGERLDQASVLAPDNRAILPERLRLLARQERYEEIVAAVSGPRLEGTRNPRPLLLAAWILAATRGDDHLHQSRKLFEKALAIDENSVNGRFGLATVIHAQGDLEECAKQYRVVLEQDPYHREALNNLAWILCEDFGRLEEARDLADRGLARYPEDPHLWDTRAVVLLKQGRLEEAAADLEKCVELAEKVPSTEARALLRLSRLAAQRGDAASARERARQARQIDDEHQVLTVDERSEVERIITPMPAGAQSSDQAQS